MKVYLATEADPAALHDMTNKEVVDAMLWMGHPYDSLEAAAHAITATVKDEALANAADAPASITWTWNGPSLSNPALTGRWECKPFETTYMIREYTLA